MARKYTSDYLNKRLAKISDDGKYGFEAFGGKAIPYIGWYWRDVDFGREDGYEFGVLPQLTSAFEKNNSPKVGFMENNKWGYDYVKASATEWANIKKLLIGVARKPSYETLEKANVAIQSLLLKK